MNISKEIVPWKCHVCRSEFDIPRGGVCSRCRQATCRQHLNQIGTKIKLEPTWVCSACLTSEEKTTIKLTSKISNLFRSVRLKVLLLFIALPLIFNSLFTLMCFSYFTSFEGAPNAEKFTNALMYVGNWSSLLLRLYPYVLSNDGEVVCEVFGWLEPFAFGVNLVGWGLIGLCVSYAIGKYRMHGTRSDT